MRTVRETNYTVTVNYCNKTPEEAEALRKRQAATLLNAKLKAMKNGA